MSGILAPHPWDTYGSPPPLGEDYQPVPDDPGSIEPGEVDRVLRLVADIDEAERAADDLETEAARKRDDATDWRDEAEGIVADWPPEAMPQLRRRLGL